MRLKGLESPVNFEILPANGAISKQTRDEKVEVCKHHFKEILQTLDLNLEDPGINDTPLRMAKLYVDELMSGLNPHGFPKCTTFPLADSSVVVQRDIPFSSLCMHHFLPFTGHAHIGYKSNGRILGLSKMNRLVEYYSRRP